MPKIILVICDGIGDRPIKEFNELTPLEKAKTPNMDKLAKNGICGLMHTCGRGIKPGSDTSHLSIFGYDPKIYYSGRGPFEATGIGIKLEKGDVAFRGNVGTLDNNMIIIDRRAGRDQTTEALFKGIDGYEIDGIKFIVKPGTLYRAGVVMRGKNLSSKISPNDPHELNQKVLEVFPLDNSKEAKFTSKVINQFLLNAYFQLKKNPINLERVKQGKPLQNVLLVRGAGQVAETPSFEIKFGLKAACIAGAGLYKGIGSFLGMDVLNIEGATGKSDTNISAKINSAISSLDKYDFVFVHIKYADSFGEDGKFMEKKSFIERIDLAVAPLLNCKDTLVIVTADHSTPCELKTHSGDPVPILMWGPGIRVDKVNTFGERTCQEGGLGHFNGLDLMPEIINIIGKAHLYGD